MSLTPEERLFFIHIPKTAGTTLIPVIDKHFHEREICPAQLWREFVHLPRETLPKYRLFRGHFGAGGLRPFLPEPPVCMTMLRAPVPLAVSTYKFIRREPGTRVHHIVRNNNMSLSDFLAHPATSGKVSNKQTRHLSFDMEHDPDAGPIFLNRESREVVDAWVRDHRVRIKPADRLERARKKLLECRFFGLVERFEESMFLMAHTFDWGPIGRVQKLMVAPSQPAREELAADVVSRIHELNRLDIELYAFAQQEFERRLSAMHQDLEQYAQPPAPSGREKFVRRPDRDADFVSPEHAETYRRLDRRHQARRALASEPKRERIRMSFDAPLRGDGWHRREASALDGTTFRWTGPGEYSTIDLPVAAGDDVRIVLCIINVFDEEILRQMRVYANGVEIDMREVASAGPGRVFSGEASRAMLATDPAALRLSIETPYTVRPADHQANCDDDRQVGLAVNWIDIGPAARPFDESLTPAAASPEDLALRRQRRKDRFVKEVKHRVAQIPVIGPRLRDAYVRLKNR